MNHQTLFDDNDGHDRTYDVDFEPCDRSVVGAERPRLSRQCRLILERLRRGPATNDQLAQISRKYTSRISDCRKAGYMITCVRQDHRTGLTLYMLAAGS